jgi:Asp-tRNA(Asn)/Glu-tRNA(Gln) amidotransferase C subunit
MYQPVISDENIQKLYRMKLKEKKPMTKLINQILDYFFSIYNNDTTERTETTCTTPDQINSPLKPSAWPSPSSESFNPD